MEVKSRAEGAREKFTTFFVAIEIYQKKSVFRYKKWQFFKISGGAEARKARSSLRHWCLGAKYLLMF